MSDHQKIFYEGIEYFHNAVAFAKSNRFGEEITHNVIALAAEYLLGAVLKKHNIFSMDGSLAEIINTLKTTGNFPEKVEAEAQKISNQCSVCSARVYKYKTNELITSLRTIKNWSETEVRT